MKRGRDNKPGPLSSKLKRKVEKEAREKEKSEKATLVEEEEEKKMEIDVPPRSDTTEAKIVARLETEVG